MASVPEFSSDYSFSDNFTQFQNPLLIPQENCIHGTTPSSATSGEEISFPMFLDNGGFAVFQQEQRNLSPSVPTAVFPDNNVSSGCGFDGGYQLQDVLDEFGEECNRILHQDFKPVNMGDNWGVQGNRMVPAVQDNNHKVVRYSVEERKDRIHRYLKKRNQRNFNKTIKYACRKALADRRVRVRGRFARNNTELHEDEIEMRKEDDNSSPINKNLNYFYSLQALY